MELDKSGLAEPFTRSSYNLSASFPGTTIGLRSEWFELPIKVMSIAFFLPASSMVVRHKIVL